MDRLATENDEFDFDDNGLQNFLLLSSRKKIVSSECSSENARDDSKFNHHEANPTGGSEDEATKIGFDEIKSYWTVPLDDERGTTAFREPPGTVGVRNYNENTQTLPNDGTDSQKSTGLKDKAENVDGRGTARSEEVEAKEAKFRSGRSAKDGGCSASSPDLEMFSFLTSVWATSFATSWQFSFSVTVGILLLVPSAGVEGALTSIPVNALFVVGQTARMNCSTDLNRPVFWARTLAGSRGQQWLYYGKNGFNGNNADSRFTIDKDEATGRYDVIIAEVQPKDAGQYICVDDSGIGARTSAELVVSDPLNCKSHMPGDGVMGYNVFGLEQDFIQVSCSLTYSGNLSPTLEWSWPGSEVENDEPTVSVSTSSLTSTLKLSPTKERNKVKWQCKANIEGATRNSVDSGLLWESETVSVRYAEFGSKEVGACPGVKWNLVCNPRCSYSFERIDEGCQCLYKYYDQRTQQNYEVASDAVKCNDNDILHVVVITFAVVAAALVVSIVALTYCLKTKNTIRLPAEDFVQPCQIGNDDNPGEAMVKTNQDNV